MPPRIKPNSPLRTGNPGNAVRVRKTIPMMGVALPPRPGLKTNLRRQKPTVLPGKGLGNQTNPTVPRKKATAKKRRNKPEFRAFYLKTPVLRCFKSPGGFGLEVL